MKQLDMNEHFQELKMTKRKLLSEVARIYDPVGFAAAFIIRLRLVYKSYGKLELTGMMKYQKSCKMSEFSSSKK